MSKIQAVSATRTRCSPLVGRHRQAGSASAGPVGTRRDTGGWDRRSRMRREFHVRFCEGPGVRFPRATRLVITFENQDDAQRVMEVLGKRMGRFGLTLHPDK